MPFLSTFKLPLFVIFLLALKLNVSCSTSSNGNQEILAGTILYPFANRQQPLGVNGPADRFIIRSTVGNTEYTIEIPDAARDYDIVVPLGDIGNIVDPNSAESNSANASPPAATDRELTSQFPKLDGNNPEELALVDAAMGVGQKEGPKQAPSYTVKLARIVNLYKMRKHEYALVEINNLLAYYPSSPRLYKMKGTVLIKLRNFDLANRAWQRALELNPEDGRLKKALSSLQTKIASNKRQAQLIESQGDLTK